MATDNLNLTETLRSVELFSAVPTKSLRVIAGDMQVFTYPAGEAVVEEDSGGRAGRMFVVLEGTATAAVAGSEIAVYGPGDYFGEMSLLDGKPRSATVVATTDLTVAGLASWNLRATLKEEPSVAQHLIEVLAGRLRAANPQHD